MSFALEYRKKHLTAPKKAEAPAPESKAKPKRRARKTPPKQVVVAVARPEDTKANRATVLGALLLAAAILAVFNSEGLRLVAGDLAEEEVGRPVLVVSEAWDNAMDRVGAKAVIASVRKVVEEAREASWADVASFTGSMPEGRRRTIAADVAHGDITGSLPHRAKHAIQISD
ncbi:MAG TPA: hypothetical protein VIG52_10870 [Methyloceanibacter sp.]